MSIRALLLSIALAAVLVVGVLAIMLFGLFQYSEKAVEGMLAVDLPRVQILLRLEVTHRQLADALEAYPEDPEDPGAPDLERVANLTGLLAELVNAAESVLGRTPTRPGAPPAPQENGIPELEQERALLRHIGAWLERQRADGPASGTADSGVGVPASGTADSGTADSGARPLEVAALWRENERITTAITARIGTLESHLQHLWGDTRRAFDNASHLTAAIPVLLAILVFLVGVAIRRQVVQPILQLNEAALRIAKGDLSVQLPRPPGADAGGGNELTTLRESMGLMVEALRERQHMEWLVRCSEKMSSIGRLAIGIAHEVNNPLANASVNLQLLEMQMQKQDGAGPFLERLQLIRRNLERAIGISRELLHFSKSDKDDFGPLNLRDPIENALMLQEHTLRRIRVRKQWLQEVEIDGLGSKLEQVFVNLFRNAADAMPGGGELDITVTRQAGRAVVTVRDNGPGIPDPILGKVFEPFVSTKGKGEGFGLGLAVCQSIVDQHGGTIDISSRPQQGATVTLTFPLSGSAHDA